MMHIEHHPILEVYTAKWRWTLVRSQNMRRKIKIMILALFNDVFHSHSTTLNQNLWMKKPCSRCGVEVQGKKTYNFVKINHSKLIYNICQINASTLVQFLLATGLIFIQCRSLNSTLKRVLLQIDESRELKDL